MKERLFCDIVTLSVSCFNTKWKKCHKRRMCSRCFTLKLDFYSIQKFDASSGSLVHYIPPKSKKYIVLYMPRTSLPKQCTQVWAVGKIFLSNNLIRSESPHVAFCTMHEWCCMCIFYTCGNCFLNPKRNTYSSASLHCSNSHWLLFLLLELFLMRLWLPFLWQM